MCVDTDQTELAAFRDAIGAEAGGEAPVKKRKVCDALSFHTMSSSPICFTVVQAPAAKAAAGGAGGPKKAKKTKKDEDGDDNDGGDDAAAAVDWKGIAERGEVCCAEITLRAV